MTTRVTLLSTWSVNTHIEVSASTGVPTLEPVISMTIAPSSTCGVSRKSVTRPGPLPGDGEGATLLSQDRAVSKTMMERLGLRRLMDVSPTLRLRDSRTPGSLRRRSGRRHCRDRRDRTAPRCLGLDGVVRALVQDA